MKQKRRVHETKTRSLAKVISGRILEVSVDTFILNFVIHRVEVSLGFAVLIEFLCALTHYLNERLWNLTDYGRKVRNGVCPRCTKEMELGKEV